MYSGDWQPGALYTPQQQNRNNDNINTVKLKNLKTWTGIRLKQGQVKIHTDTHTHRNSDTHRIKQNIWKWVIVYTGCIYTTQLKQMRIIGRFRRIIDWVFFSCGLNCRLRNTFSYNFNPFQREIQNTYVRLHQHRLGNHRRAVDNDGTNQNIVIFKQPITIQFFSNNQSP